MKLIVILITLLIVRYMHFARRENRYYWFQAYAASIQKYFKSIQQAWVLTVIILLPILIFALFLQLVLVHGIFYIIAFIFSVLVLWYCLWPISLQEHFASSLAQQQSTSDDDNQSNGEAENTDAVNTDDNGKHALSEAVLCDANTHTFAVLFWYVVLGPFGAILYRMVTQLIKLGSDTNDQSNALAAVAHKLENLLDWLPARLVGLSYVLAGNFVKGFTEWIHYVKGGLGSSRDLLIASGLGATDVDPDAPGDVEEGYQVLRMVERALIVWLVVIAILTLGQFIY